MMLRGELGEREGDALLQALTLRGRVAVAVVRKDFGRVSGALEQAWELERDLGLPDAHVLELDLLLWRAVEGAPHDDYSAKVASLLESSPPSLANEVVTSQLRLLVLSLRWQRSEGTMPSAALLDWLGRFASLLAQPPLWLIRVCEELVRHASALAAEGVSEDLARVLAAARLLAADNEQLLAWVDHEAATLGVSTQPPQLPK